MIRNQFNQYLDEKLKNARLVCYNILARVGEEAVNEAIANGSYKDRTANLRSSIGYIVVDNGEVVNIGDFESIKGGDLGSSEGKAFARSLIGEISGLGLIVVAGMNYATYVETHRNVLSSAELLAEREVPNLLKQIGLMQ